MVFWAKKTSQGAELPLEDHLLDVAFCFRSLIRSAGYHDRLETAAGRKLTKSDIDRLSILAALHDIGKINTRFQNGGGGHLIEGITLCTPSGPFGFLWGWGAPETILEAICATFSHHGVPVWMENSSALAQIHEGVMRSLPDTAVPELHRIARIARKAFPAATSGSDLPTTSAFWHLYTGLLTMADQIGSSTSNFPVARAENFKRCADKAIAERLLDGALFPTSDITPETMFGWPEGSKLTPMQKAIWDLPLQDQLTLVESETGSGKTEAALLRFRRLAEAGKCAGLYFAIPTRSSAAQIQTRVTKTSERLWGLEAALAVPGYLTMGQATGAKAAGFDVTWDDTGKIEPSRWAADAPRKYLSAPVAVGTVDQALQAAIKRKWAHMRGSALSRSLLVIDEIHASDAYMTEIMMQLLKDHLSLGGFALMMSATLTTERRHQLFEACGANPIPHAAAPYPAVTTLRENQQITIPVASAKIDKNVDVSLEPNMTSPREIARRAAEAAGRGARVLVIRNSIAGAMAVADEIAKNHPDAPVMSLNGVSAIHHSRFASIDRQALDHAVEMSLGKSSSDPVIVIGTQTLEQSLDIDADLLLTDICPIDVLLQRIGRLFRHDRMHRPEGFTTPRCIVLHDEHASEWDLRRHQIGRDRAYPDLFMIDEVRTMIREHPVWAIPSMNRYLVDRGARDDLLSMEAGQDHQGRTLSMRRVAKNASLDRSRPIQEQIDFSPIHGSRLGEMPVTFRLDPPIHSPFGAGMIYDIDVPVWLIPENQEADGTAVTYRQSPQEYRISLAGKTLSYGPAGLS